MYNAVFQAQGQPPHTPHFSQELEARRRQLEEQGDQMSSTQPAAQLRAAIQELRGELVQMDVRVGVLQHLLLRTW